MRAGMGKGSWLRPPYYHQTRRAGIGAAQRTAYRAAAFVSEVTFCSVTHRLGLDTPRPERSVRDSRGLDASFREQKEKRSRFNLNRTGS